MQTARPIASNGEPSLARGMAQAVGLAAAAGIGTALAAGIVVVLITLAA